MAKTVILKLDQVMCTTEDHCLDMTGGKFTGTLNFDTHTPQIAGVDIATTSDVAVKANSADVYTKADTYTQAEVAAYVAANAPVTDLSNYYTKAEVDGAITSGSFNANTSSPQVGDIITWDGSNWINSPSNPNVLQENQGTLNTIEGHWLASSWFPYGSAGNVNGVSGTAVKVSVDGSSWTTFVGSTTYFVGSGCSDGTHVLNVGYDSDNIPRLNKTNVASTALADTVWKTAGQGGMPTYSPSYTNALYSMIVTNGVNVNLVKGLSFSSNRANVAISSGSVSEWTGHSNQNSETDISTNGVAQYAHDGNGQVSRRMWEANSTASTVAGTFANGWNWPTTWDANHQALFHAKGGDGTNFYLIGHRTQSYMTSMSPWQYYILNYDSFSKSSGYQSGLTDSKDKISSASDGSHLNMLKMISANSYDRHYAKISFSSRSETIYHHHTEQRNSTLPGLLRFPIGHDYNGRMMAAA